MTRFYATIVRHGLVRDEWECEDCGKVTQKGLIEDPENEYSSDTFRCVECGLKLMHKKVFEMVETKMKLDELKEVKG